MSVSNTFALLLHRWNQYNGPALWQEDFDGVLRERCKVIPFYKNGLFAMVQVVEFSSALMKLQ